MQWFEYGGFGYSNLSGQYWHLKSGKQPAQKRPGSLLLGFERKVLLLKFEL